MVDESKLGQIKVLLRQAQATEEGLRGDPKAYFRLADAAVGQVNSLVAAARGALEGTAWEPLVPHGLSGMRGNQVGVGNLLVVVSNLRVALSSAVERENADEAALEKEIGTLKTKLADAEVRSTNIVDDDLKDRCLDLLLRPGKADTAVREAAVVLEDRIRKAASLGSTDYGVGLVDKALSPKTGLLDFGGPEPERTGTHNLYRGVISFFKNPASHQIVQDYDVTRAAGRGIDRPAPSVAQGR